MKGRECFIKRPLITVAMPVYNSASMLEITLKAVRNQDLSEDEVEILLLDGGSTDNTTEVAAKYNARVIQNPYRLPEPAKPIALDEACGFYFVWMGSDEEFINPKQLSARIGLMQSVPALKCLVYDRELPDKACGIANPYYIRVGDPFSMFTYRVRNGNLDTFKKQVIQTNAYGAVLTFREGDMKPIGDGSTTFDVDYVRTAFGNKYKELKFANRLFDEIIDATGCCGIASEDYICHHSAGRFKSYLSKLRFRVINNIFSPEESGYSARQDISPVMLRRRKLFYMYVLTLVGPLWHSIALTATYRDPRMLLHFFYTYYICFFAVYCMIRKLLGKPLKNSLYGK